MDQLIPVFLALKSGVNYLSTHYRRLDAGLSPPTLPASLGARDSQVRSRFESRGPCLNVTGSAPTTQQIVRLASR